MQLKCISYFRLVMRRDSRACAAQGVSTAMSLTPHRSNACMVSQAATRRRPARYLRVEQEGRDIGARGEDHGKKLTVVADEDELSTAAGERNDRGRCGGSVAFSTRTRSIPWTAHHRLLNDPWSSAGRRRETIARSKSLHEKRSPRRRRRDQDHSDARSTWNVVSPRSV